MTRGVARRGARAGVLQVGRSPVVHAVRGDHELLLRARLVDGLWAEREHVVPATEGGTGEERGIE